MATAALPPLAMSQTKDDLIKHLNMGPDTYAMMAKETDQVYKWLTSDKRHLKINCKRKPPYDWSDIVEKSKDEAMARIARSGDPHTNYYWNLAAPTEDCPNWIARWFLYHKFRYRDGRNRNPIKGDDGKHTYHSGSKHSHHHHHHHHHKHGGGKEEINGYTDGYYAQTPYYATPSMTDGQYHQGYEYPATASSSASNGYAPNGYPYEPNQPYAYATTAETYKQEDQYDEQAKGTGYWDPVRDSVNGKDR